MIKDQFSTTINNFQSNGGGSSLVQYLQTIWNLVAFYISFMAGNNEQNGGVEKKHRHIVGTSLTLLFHVDIPHYL